MKSQFRQIYYQKKRSLNEQKISNNKIVCLGFSLLPTSGVIAFYFPIKQEIDLCLLWEEAKKRKLTILFPKVINDQEMIFCSINSYRDLEYGCWGIYEPQSPQYTGDIDIMFIPGVAFGEDGSRLGYGKGYYDRFLIKNPHSLKIGVSLEENLVAQLPVESHDIFMDKILTEKRIITI